MSGQAPSYRRPRLHNFGEAAALSSPAFIVLYIDDQKLLFEPILFSAQSITTLCFVREQSGIYSFLQFVNPPLWSCHPSKCVCRNWTPE